MYVEYLSLYNLIVFFYYVYKKKIDLKNTTIFYFDKTFFSGYLLKLIHYFSSINFQYLDFKLIDVRDEKGELVRLRMFRKDLMLLQNTIINRYQIFKDIKSNKGLDNFYLFLYKSIVEGHNIMNPDSLVRAVFVIQVVLWHSKKNNISNIIFFISNRIWHNDLSIYSNDFGIKLYKLPNIDKFYKPKNLYFFHISRNNYPVFFQIFNIFKSFVKLKNPFIKYDYSKSKIFSHNQGHFNLSNDGLNSDLFYYYNSTIDVKNIICDYVTVKQLHELKSKNFSIVNQHINYSQNTKLNKKKFDFKKNNLSNLEFKFLKKNLKQYNLFYKNIYIFSKVNNIKIYLTWAKYYKDHIAQHEAIKNLNGIFALWDYAFQGNHNTSSVVSTDLYFSNFSKKFFYKNNSKIKYFINTGFLMDYKFELLKEKAQIIRNKLFKNGANYIVAIFDENSNEYERWHTGHLLQAENYEIILKELLNNPNLGVIFKPKNARTLRQRIGSVNELLVEAENTGRCFVHDYYTDNFTSAPPVLAGLSSDICIHAHLCAGTAGIECALANIPTILIDREGSPENLLYNLSDQNIIFKNWNDAIYAINNHLNSKNKNNNFGKWPDHFLNSLDNFRDGKAAFRMGEYLNTMINYIKENKSRDEVMDIAAEIYIKKYGIDKVTTIN